MTGWWARTRIGRNPRPTRTLTHGFEQFEARRMLHGGMGETGEGEGIGQVVRDFSLVDLNSTSPTYNQQVSPRDFLDQTSLWYFGHAT